MRTDAKRGEDLVMRFEEMTSACGPEPSRGGPRMRVASVERGAHEGLNRAFAEFGHQRQQMLVKGRVDRAVSGAWRAIAEDWTCSHVQQRR